MEKELVKSAESEVKVVMAEGQLKLIAQNHGKLGGGEASLYVSTDAVIDLICEKIPGTIDNALGAIIKQALKMV